MTDDPSFPKVAKVQLLMQFADGRWVFFETDEPDDAEVKMDRERYDRLLDRSFPATPDYIPALAAGGITGITLHMKAHRGARIQYSDWKGSATRTAPDGRL